MKRRRKLVLVLVTPIILLVIFFIVGPRLDGNSKKEAALMKQIKTGMDSDQVIAILGAPDSRLYDSSQSKFIFEYFTCNKAWSTLPFVEFDSAGKVTWACYHLKFQ